jgi:hypothetical protein
MGMVGLVGRWDGRRWETGGEMAVVDWSAVGLLE